jgi:pre-rRNA-processing protein IPI1
LTTQFAHHLSLLTHKSESQRRDSLAYLTSAISSRPDESPLPQPVAVILPKIQPLILDGSRNVRTQLLNLLQNLPAADVASHADQLLLYTRAGMTHLSADIRSSSLDILSWLIQVAGEDVVACPGGWVKTLNCFFSLLNWRADTAAKWTASRATFGKSDGNSKIVVKQLNALGSLLRAGFAQERNSGSSVATEQDDDFPLSNSQFNLVSKRSNPYAHLNLFGEPRNDESAMYEDLEDRQLVFQDAFRAVVEAGLDQAKKDGGEVGRAAAQVRKVMDEGMQNFAQD